MCSENRSLLSKIQKRDKVDEEKRTKEMALRDAREKARVEEEERQAVRAQYAAKRHQEADFLEFVEFRNADIDSNTYSYLKNLITRHNVSFCFAYQLMIFYSNH